MFCEQLSIGVAAQPSPSNSYDSIRNVSEKLPLHIGQYLVHSERRTADTSTFNFMAYGVMHNHYGKRYPSRRMHYNYSLTDPCSFHCIV